MLIVPTPNLAYEPAAPGVATLEKPMHIAGGPVLDEGTPVGPVGLQTFGLLAFRRAGPGALSEVWHSGHRKWLPDPTPHLGQVPVSGLAYRDGDPSPWQAIVVAAGAVDAVGQPQFAKAKGGYPAYRFRSWFATRAGATGLSAPSAPVSFAGVADRNLMVLGPADGEKLEHATEARLLLKDTGLQVIGGLVVRRDSPGAEITLSNAAGAAVVLKPDGSIELRPAPGKQVLMASDLETERIVYRPGGGGPKKTLA
ncbi:hypothetical protein [Rhodococcus wratislaviensis]|uniref:Uncharacterized protein n=1 Tax=Rhodococcus wratislaviensis NBRC 100605 TaxID=1219028 RepID=X0QBD8_RHOWR|nr:hypothetical protein [Rhodococcus wratislaviensis]GAF48246.1 hypothetical protein RW1_051_00100 [Rhodococcus wratislaviensis NBRC 100605]